MADMSTDPKKILQSAKRILLVDWPGTSIPRTLLNAGFTVFGYSPGHYSQAEIVTEHSHDEDQKNIFPPADNEKGYLVFRQLSSPPHPVDIVNIYRPENEHAAIIANHVLPHGANVLWLQPPVSSEKTRSLAAEHGLTFIEGNDIAEIARLI